MKKRAVVIIHGFGGNEKEIIYLHKHLIAQGIASFCICLTGHGRDQDRFATSTYRQWISDVKRKLDELEQIYEVITCIGFSMGGLLTLQTANRKSVDQLILCSTPIYLYNIRVITKDIVTGFINYDKKLLNYYFSSTNEIPITACLEFLYLLQRTKKQLKKQKQWKDKKKILILQNKNDETAYYKSAYYLAKHIEGQVTLRMYENGRHQLFLGANKEWIVENIHEFIFSSIVY